MTLQQSELHDFVRKNNPSSAVQAFQSQSLTFTPHPSTWNLVLIACASAPNIQEADLWSLYERSKGVASIELETGICMLKSASDQLTLLKETVDTPEEFQRKKLELWAKFKDLVKACLGGPEQGLLRDILLSRFMSAAVTFGEYDTFESMWSGLLQRFPLDPPTVPVDQISTPVVAHHDAPAQTDDSPLNFTSKGELDLEIEGQLPQRLELLQISSDWEVTLWQYHVALRGFSKQRKWNKVVEILVRMNMCDVHLSSDEYSWLLMEVAKDQNLKALEALYTQAGPFMSPPLEWYNDIITATGQTKEFGPHTT